MLNASAMLAFAIASLCTFQATDDSKKDYAQLLKRAKEYDKSLDFGVLRMAYSKSANYDPIQAGNSESLTAMYKAGLNNNRELAISLGTKILESDYLHIQTHRILAQTYTIIDNKEKASHHGWLADGLISSILKSGDGKSTSTAYFVIAIEEPYAVLHKLEFKLTDKSERLREDGHSYLVFHVLDKSGAESKVYFNQDAIFAWFKRQP